MARAPKPPTPIRRWMDSSAVDDERLLTLVEEAGIKIGPDYLRHIVSGYQRPGWDLAVRLASVTGGIVSAAEIMQAAPARRKGNAA